MSAAVPNHSFPDLVAAVLKPVFRPVAVANSVVVGFVLVADEEAGVGDANAGRAATHNWRTLRKAMLIWKSWIKRVGCRY